MSGSTHSDISHKYRWEEVLCPTMIWQEMWSLWKLPDPALLTGLRCWVSSRWAWQVIQKNKTTTNWLEPLMSGRSSLRSHQPEAACPRSCLPKRKERKNSWFQVNGLMLEAAWEYEKPRKNKELKCMGMCLEKCLYCPSMESICYKPNDVVWGCVFSVKLWQSSSRGLQPGHPWECGDLGLWASSRQPGFAEWGVEYLDKCLLSESQKSYEESEGVQTRLLFKT